MERIPLPQKISYEPNKDNPFKTTCIIEPCFPGYGVTLGNTLRRVLLSSLSGSAVAGFKVKGVHHEFSHLPGVKEDMIEIMLHLKQLRFRMHTAEPVRLFLSVHGDKEVRSGDIEPNAEVEIISPDQVIATLTDKNSKLEMEILVEAGRGFIAAESRLDEGAEVDMITIDSLFSPIRSVGYKIENVRVGQITDYERLIFEFETDGSITPEEAMREATTIILEQFGALQGKTEAFSFQEEEDHDIEMPSNNSESKENVSKKKAGRPKKEES